MSLTEDTAREIIIDAFDDISVHMDETTLGASDERTGLKGINRIMATLEANGVDLGFTKLTKGNDVVTIPEGAMDALVSLLGFRLWPKYRTPAVSAVIIANARGAVTQMYRMGITVTESEYPCTLPKGSGTSQSPSDTFYLPGDASEVSLSSIWYKNLTEIWDDSTGSSWEAT